MNRRLGLAYWVTVVAVLGSAAGVARAADWTRFRGSNGTGISDDKNVPVEFGEDKNLAWKVELPGSGNSSPIIARQRIFLQTANSDGSERSLLCLNLMDGAILWSRTSPGQTATTHRKNTLASCTAAVDGKRVYMPFWNGIDLSISAYDFDGQHRWTRDLGSYTSQHGAGHSPIVISGKVILANDQDGVSNLVALDAESGEVVWKMPRPAFNASYSTPILLERPGSSPELLITSTAGVYGYDIQSGSELWKWVGANNDKRLRTIGSPQVSQGMVFFGGGNGPGDRHSVAVRLEGSGELPASNLAWESRKGFPYVPSMLVRGEHLYFVNDKGIAACHLARTGENVWTERLEIGDVTASPLMADGKVYAVSENGKTVVFDAETTFHLRSRSELSEGVMASPAVADGRLIVRGKQHLYCFGKK